MEMRPASWRAVESILDRMCLQNREEYDRLGWSDEEIRRRLRTFMAQGEAQCLWFDGKPQAVIAVARVNKTQYPATWLVVTTDCLRGAEPIKVGRRHMRELVRRHGPIVSYLTSNHDRIQKWMRLFGAKLVSVDDHGKLFVFS